MAGDWIKMRTDLYSDPKVCVIADCLMAEDGDLAAYINQHCRRDMTVTRNVMRHVTVGALVKIWGVMRLSGKRVGDDLVRDGVTLRILDDVADLPGFGEAMNLAGWVRDEDNTLIFPNFFEDHNADPIELKRRKDAERQQRKRDRDRVRDAGRDNHVTKPPREEERREEYLESPPARAREEAESNGNYEPIPQNQPPLNYGIRIIEDLGMTDTHSNRIALEAAVKALIRDGKSGPASYGFLVAVGRDAQEHGEAVDKFFFEDQKWRNNGNGNGNRKRQPAVSASAARAERSKQNIIDGIAADNGRRAASDGAQCEVGAGERPGE